MLLFAYIFCGCVLVFRAVVFYRVFLSSTCFHASRSLDISRSHRPGSVAAVSPEAPSSKRCGVPCPQVQRSWRRRLRCEDVQWREALRCHDDRALWQCLWSGVPWRTLSLPHCQLTPRINLFSRRWWFYPGVAAPRQCPQAVEGQEEEATNVQGCVAPACIL